MNELTISLTLDEQGWVAQINYDALSLRGPDDVRRNGAAVAALMRSLTARKGISEVRVRYFNDPEYFVGGRGSSRREMFERNGTRGEEIFHQRSLLVTAHNFPKHCRTLPWRTSYQVICEAWTKDVPIFKIHPDQLILGPHTSVSRYGRWWPSPPGSRV
jgi:hypothetical protein